MYTLPGARAKEMVETKRRCVYINAFTARVCNHQMQDHDSIVAEELAYIHLFFVYIFGPSLGAREARQLERQFMCSDCANSRRDTMANK